MRGPSLQAAPGPTEPNPWYERDGGARLTQDRAAIATRYPELSFRSDEQTKQVFLEGQLTLRSESGVPDRIAVRVEFPQEYPAKEPIAFDTDHRFPHSPERHFLADEACCLWLPPVSRWDPRNPEGLVAFMDEVSIFFEKQLICDVVGYFPGAQWGHGISGYVEFVRELMGGDERLLTAFTPVFAGALTPGRNSPCPCRSGRKYKRCHMEWVQGVVEKVGSYILRWAFERHLVGLIETGRLPSRIGRHLLFESRP